MRSWDQEVKDHFLTSNWILRTALIITILGGNVSSIFIVCMPCDTHWNNNVLETTHYLENALKKSRGTDIKVL